jgi:hypothetical protein
VEEIKHKTTKMYCRKNIKKGEGKNKIVAY